MEMDSGRGCDWGVWLEWVEDSEFKWLRRDRDGDGRATLWVWVTKGWFENWLSFELLRWNADVCVAVFGWLIWIVWMKGWTRISSHFVDCRSGKKESGGAFVIDWVDLADWDLLQIWVWMRCGWFVAWFGVHFERYGGMIICCCFHDSDWISIISDADRHYFRVSTAITLSPMPLNELWGGWEGVLWVVCGTKRGVTCLSVISWTCLEELRCLFVRGGWSECFLGLWRDSCSWMPLEDTHRWDRACLNIISLWMRITLESDVMRKTECVTILAFSSEWCEFGQV